MRRHSARSAIVAGTVALTMAAFGVTPAHAQQKSISLVIAGSVGSLYNAYGRMLAHHIRRHLAGDPNIIVRNQQGAGGSSAAEFMYAQAPLDGSMFFLLPAGSLIAPLFNPSRFKYDPNKFEYVGTVDQDTRVCLTAGRSPVKTFADAKMQSVIIAGTQAGSTTVDYPNFLNALAATKF
jgi:tripartite-type tricarboxylate transporter receptor subunit TctC